jgi:hypothetical protein
MSVEIKDRGMERIKAELKLADRSFTKVGFPIGGMVGKGKGKSLTKLEKFSNISEVASIAIFQNFGTRTIPQREFMGSSFDESLAALTNLTQREYRKITDGSSTTVKSLNRMGLFMVGKTKKKIVALDTPPNRPSTIMKKGSSNPLIDTAQMVNSVSHVVKIRG